MRYYHWIVCDILREKNGARGENKNPNIEILNPKQIQISKNRNSKKTWLIVYLVKFERRKR
jgi:hypothetical protein